MSRYIKIKRYGSLPTSVSTHFILTEFQIFMHKLHLHLRPNQVSIYSLDLLQDISDLMSPDNKFYVLGPDIIRLFAPYVMGLLCLRSYRRV